MGDKSAIQWTDATWNPVTGCTKVSQGCKNCYMFREYPRLARMKVNGYADGVPELVRTWRERLEEPLHWKAPRRIFVNSMSDLFHEDVPDGFILDVFRIMFTARQHIFQILTKRSKRMLDWTTRFADTREDNYEPKLARGPEAVRAAHKAGRAHLFASMIEGWGKPPSGAAYPTYDWMDGMIRWPAWLPNVWLGVSAERQQEADERIPHLLQTPAAVRFVSYEPALGPVDFFVAAEEGRCSLDGPHTGNPLGIDWCIIGGESGPGARPFNIQWARDVVEQCKAAGVACFVKQLGARPVQGGDLLTTLPLTDRKGGDIADFPADLRVRQFPEVRA